MDDERLDGDQPEEEFDHEMDRGFFHPNPTPDTRLVLRRSEIRRAAFRNEPVAEVSQNWPPTGWRCDDFPANYFAPAALQWIEHENRAVDFLSEDEGTAQRLGDILNDLGLLIRHLVKICHVYRHELSSEWKTKHDARMELDRVADWLRPAVVQSEADLMPLLRLLLQHHGLAESRYDDEVVAANLSNGRKPQPQRPDTPWTLAFPVILSELAIDGVDEDSLREYLTGYGLNGFGVSETSKISVELQRRAKEGLAAKLLPRIWAEYPVECAQVGLPAELRSSRWVAVPTAAKQPGVPSEPATILSLGNRAYMIHGSRPYTVSDIEDCVLGAFLEQPAMDEKTLNNKSGVSRARDVLRNLVNKYEAFAPAIHFPGKKSAGGYHVSIRAAE